VKLGDVIYAVADIAGVAVEPEHCLLAAPRDEPAVEAGAVPGAKADFLKGDPVGRRRQIDATGRMIEKEIFNG